MDKDWAALKGYYLASLDQLFSAEAQALLNKTLPNIEVLKGSADASILAEEEKAADALLKSIPPAGLPDSIRKMVRLTGKDAGHDVDNSGSSSPDRLEFLIMPGGMHPVKPISGPVGLLVPLPALVLL